MRLTSGSRFAFAVAALGATSVARADLTPPARAEITLELTVENQAALPFLRFVVTNCHPGQTPSVGVLEGDAPTVCHPSPGVPVRMFGLRVGDLPEFLEMERRNALQSEAAAFMAAKAKTCGQVQDEDLVFLAETGVRRVSARYALEPGPKGGCKMRRVSATTSKEAPPPKPTTSPAATGAAAPASASSAAPVAAPAGGGGGCDAAAARPSGALMVALAVILLARRRRSRARPRRE